MYLFLPLLLLMVFCMFVNAPVALSVTLRVIPESRKTFGLGIQWFLVRLLESVPGPILFGAMIDYACVVWQESCDDSASCWIYDNAKLGRDFFFILIPVKLIVCTLFILAYKVYKLPIVNESGDEKKDGSFHT